MSRRRPCPPVLHHHGRRQLGRPVRHGVYAGQRGQGKATISTEFVSNPGAGYDASGCDVDQDGDVTEMGDVDEFLAQSFVSQSDTKAQLFCVRVGALQTFRSAHRL